MTQYFSLMRIGTTKTPGNEATQIFLLSLSICKPLSLSAYVVKTIVLNAYKRYENKNQAFQKRSLGRTVYE